MIEPGEKVHVITRRNFEGDLRRHFVGEVEAVSGEAARLRGYAFVFDASSNDYLKKPDLRTRIINLGDPGFITNILPKDVQIEELVYRFTRERTLVITDQKGFSLDVNEFSSRF